MLDCAQTAALLRSWDKILVMSHASPDGDTLGSASALLRGLVSLGKQVRFFCADPVPEKFQYLFGGHPPGDFGARPRDNSGRGGQAPAGGSPPGVPCPGGAGHRPPRHPRALLPGALGGRPCRRGGGAHLRPAGGAGGGAGPGCGRLPVHRPHHGHGVLPVPRVTPAPTASPRTCWSAAARGRTSTGPCSRASPGARWRPSAWPWIPCAFPATAWWRW